MFTSVDDLVQRQASILAEIDSLDLEEHNALANLPLPEDAVSKEVKKASRLLRGLLRTRNVGSSDHKTTTYGPNSIPGIIPALPGLFVIDLLPLPDGGFDSEQVMKTPVLAWQIDGWGYAKPVTPGMPLGDRWAVLIPTGFVIADEFTTLGDKPQFTLKEWIKSEFEWLGDSEAATWDCWTASEKAFEHSGPLPRAIWFMMAGHRDWSGTLEEMFEKLSRFRDKTGATGWPSRPVALAAVLKKLEPILAGVGLHLAHTDDGRVLVSRHSGEVS